MRIDIGEELVGAYYKIVEQCDVVSYNVRPPGGKLKGLEELDVVGLRFEDSTAFLAEVTTHITGVLYGNGAPDTIDKLVAKHVRQRGYAEEHLKGFPVLRLAFWSPYVPVGAITRGLAERAPDLELVINGEYTRRIGRLREEARKRTNDEGNDAFRLLQILEHLRKDPGN